MEKNLEFEDFQKVKIRVGTIIEVKDFPEAKKPAWKLLIDFGAFGTMKSSAQIKKLYGKDELLGIQIMAVVNFPNKQIGPFLSECLVLGVETEKGVVLLKVDKKVPNGSLIS